MTRAFLSFAALSGTGWLLDVGLTMALVSRGVPPFWASVVGAAAAVSWVYLASRLTVFEDKTVGSRSDYVIYVLWQIAAITLASVCVATLTQWIDPMIERGTIATSESLASGIAKVIITPVTLGANYAFMKWLTGRRT